MSARKPIGFCDVILNGGEAAVRDRTSAESFDVVDRTAPGARRVLDLVD